MLDAWADVLALSMVKPLVPPVPSLGATVVVCPAGKPEGLATVGVMIQLPKFGLKLPVVLENSQSTPVFVFRNSAVGDSSPAPLAKLNVWEAALDLTQLVLNGTPS